MSQYKLTYFNGRGRAEIIRLVLAQAGIEYTDHRIAGEEWPALKPTTPFGCLPTLETEGKVLGGSVVIAYYLARKHGLAGETELENAEIGGILDAHGDVMMKFMQMHFEKDDARKPEMKKKYEEACEKTFAILENKVSADGWLYGSKVTIIDLAFFNSADHIPEGMLDKFPKLKGVIEKVGALPNIAKWVKERPDTKF